MRGLFFPKLALSGIKKNGQVYFPYFLTCIVMVMMFYILHSLGNSPLLKEFKGGGNVAYCLGLAKFVIAVFAFLFLLYTNSFLNRRRYKEFGLYHVLGMGKKGLRRIVFWESLFSAIAGLGGGLFCGILFSKLAELLLANIIKYEVDYKFRLDGKAVLFSLEMFGVIFVLLMIKSLITVQRTKSLELFQSDKLGEKPPKTNWVLAIIGLALLVAAYVIACSIKAPLTALFAFFVAVIMVIIATYLLFIAGSVAFCRILKNNKSYYYKKNHFVSVSTMIFRMRRNGAGLASICILCTMVLVMLSASSCMYFGLYDSISGRYCRDMEITVHPSKLSVLENGGNEKIFAAIDQIVKKENVTQKDILHYIYLRTEVIIEDTEFKAGSQLEAELEGIAEVLQIDKLRYFVVIPMSDYNRIMGTNLTLVGDETLIYTKNVKYDKATINFLGKEWKVRDRVKEMFPLGEMEASVVPVFVMIVPDLDAFTPMMEEMEKDNGYVYLGWYYGCDLDESKDKIIEVYNHLRSGLYQREELAFLKDEDGGYHYYSSCWPAEFEDMLGLYGGVFFIGIILSILFISAMVLIIYYKQISEGFEDQKRFEIMQKVGMTKKDIRQSISSQVLTVFFAPLVLAGVHVAFAFPMIWRILQLLYVRNLTLLILISIAAFLIFGIFYAAL
ncbi:MAG: FtsX-like permease family protein, partial [Lachnospiraceae bacterium]|nr:FtsX-like permease family protein [Lachnospiraceae bacterium]